MKASNRCPTWYISDAVWLQRFERQSSCLLCSSSYSTLTYTYVVAYNNACYFPSETRNVFIYLVSMHLLCLIGSKHALYILIHCGIFKETIFFDPKYYFDISLYLICLVHLFLFSSVLTSFFVAHLTCVSAACRPHSSSLTPPALNSSCFPLFAKHSRYIDASSRYLPFKTNTLD